MNYRVLRVLAVELVKPVVVGRGGSSLSGHRLTIFCFIKLLRGGIQNH